MFALGVAALRECIRRRSFPFAQSVHESAPQKIRRVRCPPNQGQLRVTSKAFLGSRTVSVSDAPALAVALWAPIVRGCHADT